MEFNTGGSGGSGGSPSGGGLSGASGRASGGMDFDRSNPVESFVQTARTVVLSPVRFYRGMRRSGDYLNPLLFAVICSVIAAVLAGLIGVVAALAGGSGVGNSLGAFVGGVILQPIGTVIGLFIGAGIYHLLTMLLIKPNSGFEATLRVVAYASVVQLVSWIPLLGGLLALYGVVLAVLGIREAHGSTTGRAVAVVLIPTAVFLLIGLLFFAALIALVLGTQSGGV
ncbi:Uncharacterized protein conserved in archaea [Rubrobacter radiotolerans]|uniref:Uncharacterized protein conserved in archaea n=1 Tax=Rubrobacter radiotolerans TaxID=42256 RepID=A0A023X2L9_RUBRA|nr:YIP1 family protein [Rubrobacter radiotolerans]AHY46553.1 Uncharacterized protein conserved in archaea [Rubrobacter radiotolerans]MDX5893961.1 YIP1 family protein [Rubrobacter radiotolerans]SMC04858.1 hypothetical protein SAMN00767673_1269 [Rubrobacter radiotolerans DSM 5868]